MNNNYRNAYEMNNYINDNDLKRIFNGYIIYWSSRYGVDSTVRQIQAFLGDTYNKGNVTAITRDHDFRDYFMKYISIEVVNFITNFNLEKYVNDVYSYYQGLSDFGSQDNTQSSRGR